MDKTKQIGNKENWTGQGIRNAAWTHIWNKNGTLDEKIKELTWTKMIGVTIQATGQILDKYSQREAEPKKRTQDRNLTTTQNEIRMTQKNEVKVPKRDE